MNNFNNNYNNWQQSGWVGWTGYQPQFTTNIVYVTGPEEALLRTTQKNCEAVYFHQDQPVFYRVKVDNEGKKAWQLINYAPPNPDLTTPATKADVAEIHKRLSELENRFNTNLEVTNDVKSDG